MTVSVRTILTEEWHITNWDQDIADIEVSPTTITISYKYDQQLKAYFATTNGSLPHGDEPYYCSTLTALVRKTRRQLRMFIKSNLSRGTLNYVNLLKMKQPLGFDVGEEIY